MDGILALDLWDLIIDVMHSNSNQKRRETSQHGETRRVVNNSRNN